MGFGVVSQTSYVPLWCKSNFSFREGASHPAELIEAASQLGLTALALTDRNGVYGIVRAHVRARALGLKLIVGSQVSFADGRELLLLVQDRGGYRNLCRLITAGKAGAGKEACRVPVACLQEHHPGLICLWGVDRVSPDVDRDRAYLAHLQQVFGDCLYAVVRRDERPDDYARERHVRFLAGDLGVPLVAANEVLYHDRIRKPLQDVLTCIREGVSLDTAGDLLCPNDRNHLATAQRFRRLFADEPVFVDRTREIADRCHFRMDELRYRYPIEGYPDGLTTADWLRQLTVKGLRHRLAWTVGGARLWKIVIQAEKELALIRELEYEGYFLTMYEIVQYCRQHDILCQGRGSAANSVVCFALGVTNVDPSEVDVLFERFISRERAEPPDIDLDIEHNRREEVIQHVYNKYGRDYAAMVVNVVSYRAKSAIREVGKALGIEATSLDRLAKLKSHHDCWDPSLLEDAGLDPAHPTMQHLTALVSQIQGFPRHLSIHPGGFLLGHEPITDLVPIEDATMPDRTVIQWDKDDVEALGLFKVDLLGLGALTLLRICFDLLRETRPGLRSMSLLTVPRDDQATYDMICAADTVGTFQIESRAQMAMLGRLRPRCYYDLVIEISIIRPGPITGGMVHPYLRRRNGEEPVTYPHECLVPVLRKTLGIPLFQEQVISLAMVAADYSGGEADQLRRDMAAWRKSGAIEQHREKLVGRMMGKGISREFAERVFEQIKGFGEYGFPESHAASFAHIAYATCYLKCHYPVEFTCALLNAQPMGFYSVATIVQDARRHGVDVRPVDILQSDWDCTLEPAESADDRYSLALRMGMRFVKGMARDDVAALIRARDDGAGRSLDLLMQRVRIHRDKWIKLAEAGAFRCFGLSRRQALWRVQAYQPVLQPVLPLEDRNPVPGLPGLSREQVIRWDHQRSRHSTYGHQLEPHRGTLVSRGLPDAQTVNRWPDGRRVDYVGVAICRQRPGTANGVMFMTLEDETGFVNLVLWKDVFKRYNKILKMLYYVGASGQLQVADGVVHLIVDRIWAPEFLGPGIPTRSRDFR